ncbi:MAG: response regulator transcription factor [Verrucomicrobiia bacterium]
MSKTSPVIAVVDDDEPVRTALRRLLRSAGHEVDTFPSGVEFLESLKTRRPDCVVLDLHMPRINGFAVQARLAEAGIRLPLVIITGHHSAETRERVLTAGAAAYLRKPMNDQALLDAIKNVIANPLDTSAPSDKQPTQVKPAETPVRKCDET